MEHGAESIEQEEDLLRKPRLQLCQLPRELLVRTYHPPQLSKSPHDRNVYLNGPVAVQDGGSMATPCSVKAVTRLEYFSCEDVTDCDILAISPSHLFLF